MKRAFTLLEMLVVLTIATVLTTAGLVSMVGVIREARYRADRARLYMDMKEFRDRAKHGMRTLTVTEVNLPGQQSRVSFQLANTCPAPAGPVITIDYPAIDHAGDNAVCNDAITGSLDLGAAGPPVLDFLPATGGPTDLIQVEDDGALQDSWDEFPDEGCLEANPAGDPDHASPCGD